MAKKAQELDASSPALPPERQFAHLHLHTEYSLLDGGNRVDKLIKRVKQLGMTSVGITDHGNMFGAVAFYQTALEHGVKPILGVEAYVAHGPRTDRTYTGGGDGGYHLVLLAENIEGWNNLLYLCSEAFLTGFYFKPRMDREILEKHAAGLIAINGHLGSELGDLLLDYERTGDGKYWERALDAAKWHKAVFAGTNDPRTSRFFIELQHHIIEQNSINKHLIRLAEELDLPLVCDNDSHFLKAEDHDAHDTLVCISTGKTKSDPQRMKYPLELYVKSPEEMRELFEPYGDIGRTACDNTVLIADRCDVKLPLGANHAPMVRVAVPEGSLPRHDDPRYGGDLTAWYKDFSARFELLPMSADEDQSAAKAACDTALRMLAEAGMIWRYGPARAAAAQEDELRARLERELKILADKNISAYFLIVWDFVNWGRQQGIPAIARGSGVGTMVGYVLGLSNACPVRYGLLFERFTDPDRSEYPDIDIDLCQDGRASVIDYVRRKYGHVAQIITFGTLKARAAIRDVARVLEIPLPEADKIAKLIPEQLGITLEDALEQEPDLKKLYESDERITRLIDNARTLEGQARHASVHAAGVIVATRPLHEIVPLYKQSGAGESEVVTQWDGPTCEKMGLLKMDFLGLRTLSVIERCKRLIREGLREEAIWEAVGRGEEYRKRQQGIQASRHQAKTGSDLDAPMPRSLDASAHPLDLDRLTFDNPKVFELFQRGETTGIFQFESGGMRRLLIEMKPDRLEDLIAANALFRPGPMDLIPDYNRRKHGTEEVPAVHEIVDRHTAETYGVMVYQEQVMQIVHGLGGIKLRDAYSLIKNISKKKHDKIEKERPKFVEGAQRQGLTRQQAEDLFELILKFAGYGFNKSHSTGYAIVAYQTAYLKTYFPVQYMAAFLTYESGAQKVSDWIPYLEDCKKTRLPDGRVGIEVRPPDVNISAADFSVAFDDGEPRDSRHGHIRFGLGAIKGAGEKAIDAIVAERDGATKGRSDDGTAADADPSVAPSLGRPVAPLQRKPFTSLFDFCERVPAGVVNKATIEALVKGGAFDSLHGRPKRAAMAATIDQAVTAGQKAAEDRAAGQGVLFGFGAPPEAAAAASASAARAESPLASTTAWTEAEALAFEKEVLGLYVSSHPLERWTAWMQSFLAVPLSEVKDKGPRERVLIAGLVQGVRTIVVRNGRSAGQKMAIVTLEDRSGTLEIVFFTDQFIKYGHLAQTDTALFVMGEVDLTRGTPQIIVDRALPIECAPRDPLRWLDLLFDGVRLNGTCIRTMESAVELLRRAIAQQRESGMPPGAVAAGNKPIPIRAFVRVPGSEQPVPIQMGPGWAVYPTPELLRDLMRLLGEGYFRLSGPLLPKEREEGRERWGPRAKTVSA